MLLIAYTLLLPVSNNLVLYSVFASLAFFAIFAVLQGQMRLDLPLFVSWGAVTLVGLVGSVVGRENEGLPWGVAIYIVFPSVFFLFVAVSNTQLVQAFFGILLYATIALSIIIILFVGNNLGFLPPLIPESVLELLGAGFGAIGSSTQIRLYGLSTLVAAGPLWVVSLNFKYAPLLPPYWLRLVAVLLIAVSASLAGRRALIVVMLLAGTLVLICRLIFSKQSKRTALRSILLPLMLPLAAVLLPQLVALPIVGNTVASILAFFNGQSKDSAADQSARSEQSEKLLVAWRESPFLGNGFGGTIRGYARHFEGQPWAFEMQYHLILFQLGLVGAVLLITAFVLAVKYILRVCREAPEYRPAIFTSGGGAVAMLIGNVTNPYLQAPGHFWSIFLPLAVAAAANRLQAKKELV